MTHSDINITKIQDFLWQLFTSDKLKNKYFDELPSTNDFDSAMVIDCSNSIRDMDAYGVGSILLFLYAKPVVSGLGNSKVLGEMEAEVLRLIDSNTNETYTLSRRYTHSDYDAARNLHMIVLEINITI